MMRRLAVVAVVGLPSLVGAQASIPVIDLPAATVRTTQTLGAVLGIRHGADRSVLVNDALRRQMLLLDSSLTTVRVAMDSAPGTSTSYGPRPMPLIAFRGDSSLFLDWNSRTVVVLDQRGRVARALALPRPQDIVALNASASGFDSRGRLIFQGARSENRPSGPNAAAPPMDMGDSLMLLRADLDSRRIDTIGWIARPMMKITTQKASGGAVTTVYALDPLQAIDNWAVLSGGTVAIVRGHDYHIDWIDDGDTKRSSAKLPFDWRRMSDDDKRKLSDSLRVAQDSLLAIGYPGAELTLRGPVNCGPPDGGRGSPAAGGGAGRSGRGGESGGPPPPDDAKCTERLRSTPPLVGPATFVRPSMPPLAELYRANPIPDYAPPIRMNTTIADLDDNVWILPRTSTLSRRGELVYDVVNAKGELFQRVRLPLGRAVAGFGKGGVVYLTSGDMKNGYYLERTTLPVGPASRK